MFLLELGRYKVMFLLEGTLLHMHVEFHQDMSWYVFFNYGVRIVFLWTQALVSSLSCFPTNLVPMHAYFDHFGVAPLLYLKKVLTAGWWRLKCTYIILYLHTCHMVLKNPICRLINYCITLYMHHIYSCSWPDVLTGRPLDRLIGNLISYDAHT